MGWDGVMSWGGVGEEMCRSSECSAAAPIRIEVGGALT